MAVLVRGRIGPVEAVGYWIAQLVAGLLAALVIRAIVTPVAVPVPGPATPWRPPSWRSGGTATR
jgi:glycerol uptake facilitator-like aquaporin